jgi:hypothetical protein
LKFSVLRYKAWRFIRNPKREEFTISQILRAHSCTGQRKGVARYIDLLLAHEYVETMRDIRRDGRGEFVYRLVKDTGPCAPLGRMDGSLYDPNVAGRCEQGQQRIWNVLRLANCALTKAELATRSETHLLATNSYLAGLTRYDYLKVTPKRPKTYFLKRDTGPFYPAWQDKRIFDQNLGTYMEAPNDADETG